MSQASSKLLVIIPARGGSKGVPRKNVRELAGKPLIAHTVDAALEAACQAELGPVVVSTDDEEISEAAVAAGAEVPFLRPASLATDTASSVDVMLHAVDTLCPDEPDVALCLLQPTSPFREARDIVGAVELFRRTGKAVVGVTPATKPPQWLLELDEHGQLRRYLEDGATVTQRQEAPRLFSPNGAIYVMDAGALRRTRQPIPDGALPWEMPAWRSVDIDTELDWLFAEALAACSPAERRQRFNDRSR
jgi:CMP-N-acetylneuraminic acid synthetase